MSWMKMVGQRRLELAASLRASALVVDLAAQRTVHSLITQVSPRAVALLAASGVTGDARYSDRMLTQVVSLSLAEQRNQHASCPYSPLQPCAGDGWEQHGCSDVRALCRNRRVSAEQPTSRCARLRRLPSAAPNGCLIAASHRRVQLSTATSAPPLCIHHDHVSDSNTARVR